MRKRYAALAAPAAVAALVILALAGCGGGPAASTVTKASFAKGSIAQFGSIFVNGIEYDTTNATVTINGAAGTAAGLKLGMQVDVEGDVTLNATTGAITAATASKVDYKNSMEGMVDGLNVLAVPPVISVLGQTIKLDVLGTQVASDDPSAPLAAVSDITGGSLWPGDVVEIAATPDASGNLLATRLELKIATANTSNATQLEVDGTVSSLTAGSFHLTPIPGSLAPITVNYTGTLTGITEGSAVEVAFTKGDYVAADPISGLPVIGGTTTANGTALAAAKIELKVDLAPTEGDYTSVEGVVTSLSGNTFKVNGISIDASGVPNLAGLVAGAKVDVYGTFTNGALVATKIEVK